MAWIDNPFSLFEVDDDEVDPIVLLARAEAKKTSDASAAAAGHDQQQPQLVKEDTGGRVDRGRGGGRDDRGRGLERAGRESWGQHGEGYSRGYGAEYDGRGGRSGRVGRGGLGRGRGRGYYEYRATGYGNEKGEQYGSSRVQAQDGNHVAGDMERSEVHEVQGKGYYGNRRGRAENNRFSGENQSLGWDSREYDGKDRRYGGPRSGRYEKRNWNQLPKQEDTGEDKPQNDGNDDYGGSAAASVVTKIVEVPKDSENEVPKNADVEKASESAAPEDASEKKNPEDDTMTFEEYEKVRFEKRKALEALQSEGRKVDIDVVKTFGGMTLVGKKKEEDVFVKLKSDKDKLRKAVLEKEEKTRKAPMNINEFLKPADGEAYMGPSYARERAARIRSERRAREDEERIQNAGEEESGPFVDTSVSAPSSGSRFGGGVGRGRGGRRGRGQRGGGGGGCHYGGDREPSSHVGGGVTIPENEESLDKEFPILGGTVKT